MVFIGIPMGYGEKQERIRYFAKFSESERKGQRKKEGGIMVVTEWYELRGGFISADVIRWRETIWIPMGTKGRRVKQGGGFGGQRVINVGARTVCAEVIQGPDDDGWVYLLVRQYDNLAFHPVGRLVEPPRLKVGSELKRKYKTILNGDPHRLPWSDENARARLVREAWSDEYHAHWMSLGVEEDQGS